MTMMTVHRSLTAFSLWLTLGAVRAEMVQNSTLRQDSGKEQMCAERARVGSYQVNGKAGLYRLSGRAVPFKILDRFVDGARSVSPASVFIALDDGSDAWMVECYFGRNGDRPAEVSFVMGQSDSRWSLLTAQDQTPVSKPILDHNSDLQDMVLQRQRLILTQKSADAMLNTRSLVARARIFCRSQQVAFPLLPSLGTVEALEVSYSQLTEQPSPDPYALQAWSQRLTAAYENMRVCQGEVINYGRRLPTDDEEREMTRQAKQRIAEIDEQIAHRK